MNPPGTQLAGYEVGCYPDWVYDQLECRVCTRTESPDTEAQDRFLGWADETLCQSCADGNYRDEE